jgi:hypothetical protein
MPIEYAPTQLSIEENAVHASNEVMVDIDGYSAPIIDNPRGIFGQKLRPHIIHFLRAI